MKKETPLTDAAAWIYRPGLQLQPGMESVPAHFARDLELKLQQAHAALLSFCDLDLSMTAQVGMHELEAAQAQAHEALPSTAGKEGGA